MRLICGLLLLMFNLSAENLEVPMKNPVVMMRTTCGDITIELDQAKAPETVKNFLQYVDEKFYDKTIFHRVIDDFMIQGGGFTKEMEQKAVHAPIRNEAENRLPNNKGTLAMARTSDVNSATAQFFINVKDNEFLNYKSSTPSGFGYCVFGKVISGMDVLDKIKKVPTTTKNGHQNVPVTAVEVISVTRVQNDK